MRRCGLFALSFVLFLTASFTAFSNNASASSVYDDWLIQAETLIVNSQDTGAYPCSNEPYQKDWSTSYGALIMENQYWSQTDIDNGKASEYRQAYNDSLDSGDWVILNEWNGTDVSNGVNIVISYSPSGLYVDWISGAGAFLKPNDNSQSLYELTFVVSGSQTCEKPLSISPQKLYNRALGSPDNSTTSNSGSRRLFIVSGTDMNYPAGYEGVLPWEEYGDDRPVIKPEFTGQLDNKRVSAIDINQNLPTFEPEAGYSIVNYQLEWTLFSCTDDDWDETTRCTNPDIVKYEILDQTSQFKHEVENYGHYVLEAQYLVQQCYRYESYPSTPDYCFYADLGAVMPDYRFLGTTIHLNIDGRSETFDTQTMYCDESGYCRVSDELCFLEENIMEKINCQMQKQMRIGLLNPSINAFKGVFTSFVVPPSPSCNIPIQDVVIVGKTLPLKSFSTETCSKTALFRGQFPIMVVMVNFFFGLLILYMLARIINSVLNHNHTDVVIVGDARESNK